MLFSINFDNQFRLRVEEIDNIFADYLLSVELVIILLFHSYFKPEKYLAFGQVFTEFSGIMLQL
jgi:hypothetical protein